MSATPSRARTIPLVLLVGALLALVLADAARGDDGSDPEAPSSPDPAAGAASIAAPAPPACSAVENEAVDSGTAAPRAEPAQLEPAAKAAPESTPQALADEAAEAAAPEAAAAAPPSPSRSDPEAQPGTARPSSPQARDCRGADPAAARAASDASSGENEGGSALGETGSAASDGPNAPSASPEQREASADKGEEGRSPGTTAAASPASPDPAPPPAPVTDPSPSEPDTSPPEPGAGALDATEPPPPESEIAGERDPAADALITVLNRITGERFAHERSFASPPRPRSVLLRRHAPRFALERRTRRPAAPGSLGRPPGRAEPRRARKTGERVGGAPDKKSPLLADSPERSSSGSSTGLSSAVQSPTTPVGEFLTLSPLVPLVGGSRRVPTAARPCHPHVEWVADEKPG